jgi:hypothetical protein
MQRRRWIVSNSSSMYIWKCVICGMTSNFLGPDDAS